MNFLFLFHALNNFWQIFVCGFDRLTSKVKLLLKLLRVTNLLHSCLWVILFPQVIKLLTKHLNTLHIVRNLLTVQNIKESLDLLYLISQSLEPGCWLPPAQHMVYEWNPLLQRVKLNQSGNVSLCVVYDQLYALLLRLGRLFLHFGDDFLQLTIFICLTFVIKKIFNHQSLGWSRRHLDLLESEFNKGNHCSKRKEKVWAWRVPCYR